MESSLNRRAMLGAMVGAGTSLIVSGPLMAQANSWPNRPVRVIIPFPGGASDVLTRLVMEKLQTTLHGTFFGDVRSGAGGNIGMEAAKSAAPDGYTAASATIGTLSINQFLFPKLPYDPVADFAYVSRFWEGVSGLIVPASNPANTVQEFLSALRKQPKISFGSPGVGTAGHLSGELFRLRTELPGAVHIPYRGAAQAVPALAGGEVDFAIDNVGSFSSLIQAGRVKLLGVSTAARWPTLPNVPTLIEAGVKDFVTTSWGTMVMPKNTPAEIVEKLSLGIQTVCSDAGVQQRFADMGLRALVSSPAEAMQYAELERVKWKEVIRVANVTV
ncbi:tripartite tricarboxylate transporter substrate binding protein [soil metagenome]